MTNLIKSADEYRKWITNLDGERVANTLEFITEQIEIPTSVARLPFVDDIYLDVLWRVMHSCAPPGIAASIGDLTTLDYYKKRGEGWFSGATALEYGSDIFSQLPGIISELKRDRLSRRAVIRMTGDKCCISIQFLYRVYDRDGVDYPMLLVLANFRSADIVWGIPVDFHWLKKLSGLVEAEVGEAFQTCIVIHAGSMHLYTKDAHLI